MTAPVQSPELLLSKLKRERPVCFRPEEFFEEGFEVDKFLALNRKSFTLESLKKDLANYSTTIQNSLVELINRDYADFVNLSTNLVGVDQTILKLEAPLIDIHADIGIIRRSIGAEIDLISEKLQLRSQIRSKQEILHGLLMMEKLTNKIETLVNSQTEEKENLFERVASEYSQLQFYVDKNQGLPFVTNLLPRINKISEYLEGGLHNSFKTGLRSNDKSAVTQCLRIFTTLGRVNQAEQLFTEAILDPVIDNIVSKEVLREEGLGGMYAKILDALPPVTSLVLSLTSPRKVNELRSFDFMTNATFPAIVSKLCSKTPALFAAGDPKQFQQNYKETIHFVGEFEQQCQFKERVLSLRQHPSYKTFMSKWSLPIYFQIRLQEIAGSLEHQLLSPFTFPNDIAPSPCTSSISAESQNAESQNADLPAHHLPVTEMLFLCLRRCWDEEVLLKPLTHRFLKLSLQLLRRYTIWLGEIPTSSDELLLSDVCKAVHDAHFIAKRVPVLLGELTRGKTPECEQEMITAACQDLIAAVPILEEYVISEVISSASKALEQTQAVPRLYRRTNRELPVEPLSYVSSLVEPLHREIWESALPEPLRRSWCCKAAHILTVKYSETVSEVLVSLRKTEDSLAMLKRGRRSQVNLAAGGSTQSASDEDKIRAQLRLDVIDLASRLEAIGSEKGEEYAKLETLVSAKR